MSEVVGERLKALRERKKLSQAQLSKLCGWATASRVGNYELGVRNIGIDDAVVLARVLDTTPSYLLFGDELNKGQELPQNNAGCFIFSISYLILSKTEC
ncbi:helix-turn-helix domain-containing protein [Klebsiella pneumoniae]